MTSAEMLARVRTLLDESSAAFFTDAEIYSALSDGQREVTNFALGVYRQLRAQNVNSQIPEAIKELITTATGTIAAAGLTANLPADYLEWIRADLAHTAGSVDAYPCYYRENTLGAFASANTYLAENITNQQHYFTINATQVVFFTPGAVSVGSSYTFVYFKKPTEISGAVQPILSDFTHEAIVQYAYAYILGKDQRTTEASNEYGKFRDYLARLV